MYKYTSQGTRKNFNAAKLLAESIELPNESRLRIRQRKKSHPQQTYFEVMLGVKEKEKPIDKAETK